MVKVKSDELSRAVPDSSVLEIKHQYPTWHYRNSVPEKDKRIVSNGDSIELTVLYCSFNAIKGRASKPIATIDADNAISLRSQKQITALL